MKYNTSFENTMESVGLKEKTIFSFVFRIHQKIKALGSKSSAVVFC